MKIKQNSCQLKNKMIVCNSEIINYLVQNKSDDLRTSYDHIHIHLREFLPLNLVISARE